MLILDRVLRVFKPKAPFDLPSGTERVWIDVGSDWSSFTSRDFTVWPALKWPGGASSAEEFSRSEDLVSIAIDANKEYLVPLAALPRTIPVHAAITGEEGTVVFRHYEAPGASSVLPPGDQAKGSPGIPDICVHVVSEERVPSHRLETILDRIPKSVRVEFVKVDAQGIDLDVVKSAGRSLKRIEKVMIEVQKTSEKNPEFYKGQNGYDEAVSWMTANGFALNNEQSWIENVEAQEWNLVFDRNR